mgnify:CR=1 FL=1
MKETTKSYWKLAINKVRFNWNIWVNTVSLKIAKKSLEKSWKIHNENCELINLIKKDNETEVQTNEA